VRLAIEKQQLNAYRKDLKEEYRIFEEAARRAYCPY
jgi:DNA-directed RNA polymerase subunit beta